MDWRDVFGEDMPEESETFEAKKAGYDVPDSFWETFSAFANSKGGRIVLGVSEEGPDRRLHVTGVKDHGRMAEDIRNMLDDRGKVSRHSVLRKDVYTRFVEGKAVIVVKVPRERREFRPVYINGNPMEGTYRRSGEGDYRCTEEEVLEMFRDASAVCGDSTVLTEYGPDVLDAGTVSSYRMLLRSYKPRHPWLQKPDGEFLRLLGALSAGDDGDMHPTVAGLLMFGTMPDITRAFPQYMLDYHETEPGGDRWSYRINSNTGDWSGNVFDFYMGAVNRLETRIGSPFALDGFQRRDDSEELEVVREAVMNALVHADYHGTQGIVVKASHVRVLVGNPGTFRIPLSRARAGGVSDPRNPTLMKMMMLVGLAERMGGGVRMMEDANARGDISGLLVSESYDPSRVTVAVSLGRRAPADSGETAIMEMMIEDPSITLAEISERTGTSQRTVSRIVDGLKGRGLVAREGSRRSGRWVVRTDAAD